MIYKAQFETKRSRVDFDECDIKFSVGLSKEDFDHLRTNLLEESKVYQAISSHARQERRG